ncbi:beta-N-acetylhexosaminidase [Lacticaseibacillus absianus]|uniref:beta-N-acetylhexosaminidase n=1 Tax=Lacticaseibacillus absianus TaxID=2729623 RepID=UPI0015CACCCB|nr:beta-N-acetylhexosaminidase [Lacticaseibacillus absianus]
MIEWIGLPEQYTTAVELIAAQYHTDRIQAQVSVSQDAPGLTITREGTQGTLRYGSAHDLMRAVTLWLGHAQQTQTFELSETPAMDEVGVMIDLARNGVLTVETLKQVIIRLASLGYTELWLYLEDCFEIPKEPYFGHLRGRYSQEDLHALALFADQFGLRLVPAIQTLAHLQNALKWTAFERIKDTPDVLWVEKPETTTFIRAMLKAATAPFLTNKIHIGMDEAYGLGHGNRLYHEGYVDQATLIQAHLRTVSGLCSELGLVPYMWSDMWFTIASPQNTMYDESVHFDPAFVAQIPPVGQVYWDYYHEDVATYEKRLAQHFELKQPIVYAGGLWTWSGLAPHQEKMLQSVQAGMTGAKAAGVRQAIATMWFDDGAETPMAASWLGLQTFIEYQYHDTVSLAYLAQQFRLMQGESAAAFQLLDDFDHLTGAPANLTGENPSKLLLYEDLMLQKYVVNLRPFDLETHYTRLAAKLSNASTTADSRLLFDYYRELALALAKKARALQQLKTLPSEGVGAVADVKAALVAYKDQLGVMIRTYRAVWHRERRGNGYEVMDIRLGGQLERVDTVLWRLEELAAGRDDLAELQAPELLADKWTTGPVGHGLYMQIASACDLSH